MAITVRLGNAEVSGLRRSIDKLGRITVPKEIRDLMDVGCGKEMEILICDAGILLTPVQE